jgi:hypothetical protein
MRPALVLMVLLVSPQLSLAQNPSGRAAATGDEKPARGRFDDFVRSAVLSPAPYLLAVGGGAIDQLADFPDEWRGAGGFGRRTLARAGGGFASDVVGHTAGALLRHRVLYESCGCSGAWRRTGHALSRGFVTRTAGGGLSPHVSLFAAKAAAAGLGHVWYPKSYTGRDAVREAVAGVGASAALNIAREFGPELMRILLPRAGP